MPTQTALSVVDTLAEETSQRITQAPLAALRTQAAFIRSLVDEVESRHPADRAITNLREQLSDELIRLAEIIRGGPDALAEEAQPVEILVVDDEDAALRTTARVLHTLGYACRTAPGGVEALDEFTKKPTPIVISDWSMPGMDGLDLCNRLRSMFPAPYFILVTAFHENARLLDAVRGGAHDFLRKPLDLDELEARLFAATRLLGAVNRIQRLRA